MSREKISYKLSVILSDEIKKLNSKQIYRLIKQCEMMTQTNCWWFTYRLKDALLELASDRLSHIKHRVKVKNETG